MARYDWYILRIWRSGRATGEQWAARLEQRPGGLSLRFTEPHDLLAYLAQTVVPIGEARDAGEPPGDPGAGG